MKRSIRMAIASALASLCLCASAGAKLVTIKIPGSSYVVPVSINDKGQVTGYYTTVHQSLGDHGFIWQPDGTLVTFDVPNAVFTEPVGISPDGVVTGVYEVGKHDSAGFVRAADGSIATFRVPHGRVTAPRGANRKGWSVGTYYAHDQDPNQAFLRSPFGATTEFSLPGVSGGAGAVAVNSLRTIAGQFLIPNSFNTQGFIRTADGTIRAFGDPDETTSVTGINDDGTISGWQIAGQQTTGYFRTIDGTITTFAAPNGPKATYASAINNSGTIAGWFVDSDDAGHGFLRAADGTFTSFDVDGAIGIQVRAMNNKGAATGSYMDQDGNYLGFAGKP